MTEKILIIKNENNDKIIEYITTKLERNYFIQNIYNIETQEEENTHYQLYIEINNNKDKILLNTNTHKTKTQKDEYKTFNKKEDLLIHIKSIIIKKYRENIIVPFCEQIQKSTLEDIDKKCIDNFKKITTKDKLTTMNTTQLLQQLNAGKLIDNKFYLNNTGILFFTKKINKKIACHKIRIRKYDDKEGKEFIKEKTINTPIFEMIEECEKTIKDLLDFNYPYKIIQEVIINAIVHRNYEIENSIITVNIYPDRLEITSPGQTIRNIDVNELYTKETHYYRNKNIQNIINLTNYINPDNSGLLKLFSIARNESLKKPKLELTENNFKVTLYNKRYKSKHKLELETDNLNIRQINFIQEIKKFDKINYQIYMKKYNVSMKTAGLDLNQLVEMNILKKVRRRKIEFYSII